MINITERELEKLKECLKQIKSDKDREEIGEKVVRLYETIETCKLSEVFRHVLKGYNLDESIAKGLEEDKKPFLKLPASVRYEFLSTGDAYYVQGLQDMKNQERRKGNFESDETLIYSLKLGEELNEIRIMRYAVWAACWDSCGKYEYLSKKSEALTEKYIKTLLKYDKDGEFKFGFSNHLEKCEKAEKNDISSKYAKLREKYLLEDENE